MDDTMNQTATTTEIHDHYVAQINHLVGEGRETLIADLTAEYEQQLREERRAA